MLKQRRNRALIYRIGLRFYCMFETFCLVKNRAPIWNKSGYDYGTLHLSLDLMRKSYSDLQHRSTIFAFLEIFL